jgi:hypothetical protein
MEAARRKILNPVDVVTVKHFSNVGCFEIWTSLPFKGITTSGPSTSPGEAYTESED